LLQDFFILNNQLEDSVDQQINSIKAKQSQIISEKETTSLRQTGKLAFARLKVELQVEEVDYNSQIKDCSTKIAKLQGRREAQKVVNEKVYQDCQALLESAVEQLTSSDAFAIDALTI
jgi:hypothetical protein